MWAIVNVVFSVLIVAIVDLAWAVAVGTSGPWFSPGVSFQVYSVSLVLGSFLTFALAAIASARVARLDDVVRVIDERLEAFQSLHEVQSVLGLGEDPTRYDPTEAEVDRIAYAPDTESLLEVHPTSAEVVMQSPAERAAGARDQSKMTRRLLAARRSILAERGRAWPAAIGPICVSIIFVAISGAMLPGSEGFAQRQYQLNTTLILLLGYGWWPLLAWAVAALFRIHSPRGLSSC